MILSLRIANRYDANTSLVCVSDCAKPGFS
jgi:hypothetical protein